MVEKNSEFLQGFYAGMIEAARTLREASHDHNLQSQQAKKVVEIGAHMMAASLLSSWANGLEINARKALK